MKPAFIIISLSVMLLASMANAQFDGSENGAYFLDDYNNINHNFEEFGDGLQEGEGNQLYAYGSEPGSMLVNGQPVAYSRSSASANSLWIQESNQQLQQIQCSMFSQLKLAAYSSGGNAIMTEVYPDGHSIQNQYYFQPGYNEIVFAPDVPGRHTLGYDVNGQLSNTVIIDVIDPNQDHSIDHSSPDMPLVEQNLTVIHPVERNYSIDSTLDEETRNAITWDFETGDLNGWEKSGDAFDNSPKALGSAHIGWINNNNQGTYWISSEDESKGALTSQPFVINGNKISFLIGGSRFSCYYNCEESGCYAALIIGENAVEIADGNDSMRMERVEWDVSAYRGKTAEIQLVDDSSNGHVSFDEVQFDVPPTITNLFTVRDGESIQAAIDRATPGDLIEVYSGTHRENLNVNKKLDLYGVDMGEGNPVIDAQNLGSAITISADGVDLGWFNVTNSRLDAGIIVHSSWNSIHDIFAFNNSIGMLLSQNSHNEINLTAIGGNIGGSAFSGLVIDNSSNNIVRGIDVSDNDVGISIRNSRNNEITSGSLDFGGFSVSKESYIKENKIGIQLFNSYYNSIRNLNVEKNDIGIILSNSYGNILNYNILGGNAATASDDGNNQWSDNFYGAIAGATFEQCGETYTYYIPDGSNVDRTAIKVYCPVAPAKSGKGASKKHENEHKK